MNALKVGGILLLGSGGAMAFPAVRQSIRRMWNANRILFEARNLLGEPYVWGGRTLAVGFDCSGFIQYVIGRAIGITTPPTITTQVAAAPYVIDIQDMSYAKVRKLLRPGDAISLNYDGKGDCDHGGFYEGRGKVIHSSGSQSCPQSSLPCKVIRADLSRWENTWQSIYAYHREPNTP